MTDKEKSIRSPTAMSDKIKLKFEVVMDKEYLIDDEGLKAWSGSWLDYLKWLYEEEGIFWDEPMELVGVEEK